MKLLQFIESRIFTNNVDRHLTSEQYYALQRALVFNPNAGDVIPGTHGCRKVRWVAEGRGKRGGTRIIYYYQAANGKIYLLMIYAKNEECNYPAHLILALRQEVQDE